MADATKAQALGQARIAGRIAGSRRLSGQEGTTYRTLMKLPAIDRFSSPQTVEVRSAERLGNTGDEVSITVELGGYPRSYDTKPKGQDEGGTVHTAENVLKFVAFA